MKRCGKILEAAFSVWTSRKLWMTLIGVSIVFGLFRYSVMLLWSFSTPEGIVAFNSMYQTAMICITAIVATYCGVQGVQNIFSRTVSDSTEFVVKNVREHLTQNITITERYDPLIEKKYADKFADDPSYRPPATVPDANVEDFR